MTKLVVLYIREKGHLASAYTIEKFCRWVSMNLRNQHSQACRLLKNNQLALTERRPSWWMKQIAERRKRFK